MPLTLRDSLTGRTEPLRFPRPGPSTLYVCGPTVYDSAHVGHARTYLYFDLIRRLLSDSGRRVHHVMNMTDVEDKITQRARELGIGWRTLARREEGRFLADLKNLGILLPHQVPRASEFVRRMIPWIARLHKSGRVYRKDDEWWYSPAPSHQRRNFPVGRELSRHLVPEPGVTDPPDSSHRTDFQVWKRQPPPLPSWPSPWGPGVPGWHLECFTMANAFLGLPVDLHGGGFDLIFPHHYAENELALTLRGSLFSRRFLHTGFVTENGRKMSKSVGNLVPLRQALKMSTPSALRWYLLSRPSNQRIEWSTSELRRVSDEYEAIARTCRSALSPGSSGSLRVATLRATRRRMREQLSNGLHVEQAFATLREWAVAAERSTAASFPRGTIREAREEFHWMERVTGLALL